MKKLIVLFSLVFGIVVMANAQSKPADFKFEKETHDFGMLSGNKPVSFDFKFTNVGDEPLIISKVEASCGCTVPEYTSVPVKKGATGVIKVTFTPTNSLAFNKFITITSNAKTPSKVIYIKGNIPPTTSK
jgi:hypothetical protein